MRTLAAAAPLLATILPSTSSALSCMEPDLAAAVQWIAEAPEPYAILLGTLTPTGEEVVTTYPDTPDQMAYSTATMQARFEGRRLGTWGFRETEPAAVTMDRICDPSISSCPSFDGLVGRAGLLIARVTPEGYHIQAQACGSNFFPDPTRQDLRIAYDCAFGRDCPVRPENR